MDFYLPKSMENSLPLTSAGTIYNKYISISLIVI